MSGQVIKILAIDGGGIRGIIPALILAEVERRTNQPIAKLFDLIAGSSTGGMVAMGLVTPNTQKDIAYTAEEIALMYEQDGSTIFAQNVWRSFQTVGSINGSKYASHGMDEVLDRYFGEYELSDALADVLITSYEIQRRQPWFFRSHKARQSQHCNFKMRDVVRSTTAAPTFFEPAQVFHPEAEEFFALIDGSLQANNPSLCAYVEMKNKYPHAEFLLLSIGTGDHLRPLKYEDARQWGLAGWSQHIMNIAFDASSSTVDYQLRHLIPSAPNGARRYYRMQGHLDGVNEELDDASPKNIIALKNLAKQIIQQHDRQFDELVEQLLQ